MRHDANDVRGLATIDMRRVRAVALAAALGGLLAGCGGGGSSAPPMPAMSTVTLVISSDADDLFTSYTLELQGITLTNAAGKTVTLLSSNPAPDLPSSSSSSYNSVIQNLEFIHVNGKIEPHVTVTIPQDTYTSAAITLGGTLGTYQAACGNTSEDLELAVATGITLPVNAAAAITVPQPLVVNAENAVLMLKLLVSQSATADCATVPASGQLTPTFTLSSLDLSATPASPQDGKVEDLQGQVQTIDGQTIQMLLALNPASSPIAIVADNDTVFDGVSSVQDLTAMECIIVNGSLQADGSVRATRVTVRDPMTISALSGQVLALSTHAAGGLQFSVVDNLIAAGYSGLPRYLTDGSTALSFFDAPDNLTSLPFTPGATSATLVPGQNVYVTPSTALYPLDPYDVNDKVAGTVTLLPQTIDAQISSIGTSGNFTVYTVSLASYDPFVLLAGVTGQLTQLASPGTVTVYVDGSTQVLSSKQPAVGDTLRFYGLVLNNSGTLAMDCIRILDGVPFSSAPSTAGG